ncbi:hypothetical protein ACXU4B_08735 [Dyella soli]|uniref:hypothetical protein n=1 Tax=Dyella soli TaxID=522319 RepID=UPI0013F3B03A|nr:hypothetical protein [Dyella soli]
MFGWLAHTLAPFCPDHGTAAWPVSRCAVWMSGPELMARLPLLGAVLYLRAGPL